ncbi:MAG: HepT-like ribonuclease domain-containing protein [Desulfobacterales bacterium]
MLDYAREAVKMAEGKERSALRNDRILELAVIRLIEIVGEAAVKVSIDGKAKFSGLPWPQIIAMRNRLIHGYDAVDLDVLWDTIENDLPDLISKLEKELSKI